MASAYRIQMPGPAEIAEVDAMTDRLGEICAEMSKDLAATGVSGPNAIIVVVGAMLGVISEGMMNYAAQLNVVEQYDVKKLRDQLEALIRSEQQSLVDRATGKVN